MPQGRPAGVPGPHFFHSAGGKLVTGPRLGCDPPGCPRPPLTRPRRPPEPTTRTPPRPGGASSSAGRHPPTTPTPREGQPLVAGPVDHSEPTPTPLTAAVAFRAAGTMAGSGVDMLLPHIHRLSSAQAEGRAGARPLPKGVRAASPGRPHRAHAQARARQRGPALPSARARAFKVRPALRPPPLPPRLTMSGQLPPSDWLRRRRGLGCAFATPRSPRMLGAGRGNALSGAG